MSVVQPMSTEHSCDVVMTTEYSWWEREHVDQHHGWCDPIARYSWITCLLFSDQQSSM